MKETDLRLTEVDSRQGLYSSKFTRDSTGKQIDSEVDVKHATKPSKFSGY